MLRKTETKNMKKQLLIVALASLVATQVASAYTITKTVESWAAGGPNAVTFDAPNPAGVIFSLTPDSYIAPTVPAGDPTAAPYGDTSNYLSVGVTGTATFAYTSTQKALSLLWGSIDSYNKITFFLSGVEVVTIQGNEVPDFGGDQGPGGTATVNISGLLFDEVVLSNFPGIYAFEVDNIQATAAPDGGMTASLLGLAVGCVAFVRRKIGACA